MLQLEFHRFRVSQCGRSHRRSIASKSTGWDWETWDRDFNMSISKQPPSRQYLSNQGLEVIICKFPNATDKNAQKLIVLLESYIFPKVNTLTTPTSARQLLSLHVNPTQPFCARLCYGFVHSFTSQGMRNAKQKWKKHWKAFPRSLEYGRFKFYLSISFMRHCIKVL